MADPEIAQMAHLMRRAGFGATRDELERRVAVGYEATVEELLDPDGNGVARNRRGHALPDLPLHRKRGWPAVGQ